MQQKNANQGNTAIKNDDVKVRITSSRTFFRNPNAKKVALVPAHDHADGLSSKEAYCAANATD